MDLEHSGETDTEPNERMVESGRKVLGMVFSRAFKLVLDGVGWRDGEKMQTTVIE